VAKAVRASRPTPPRGPVAPPRAEKGGNYFREVYQELRKVAWPTWDELRRMTGVVIVTVILLAAIIGLADLLLSIVVKQLYTSGGTTLQTFQKK
jgi:preprotein translocase subunit SecE